MKKNSINSILENLLLNETKSIDLGSGRTAYQYNGKYYIKSGDTKKEISADQYNKLLSKDKGSSDKSKSEYEYNRSYDDKSSRELLDKFKEFDADYDNMSDEDIDKWSDDITDYVKYHIKSYVTQNSDKFDPKEYSTDKSVYNILKDMYPFDIAQSLESRGIVELVSDSFKED